MSWLHQFADKEWSGTDESPCAWIKEQGKQKQSVLPKAGNEQGGDHSCNSADGKGEASVFLGENEPNKQGVVACKKDECNYGEAS